MSEKKLDRRIQYTRMVIEQSFIKILKDKNISKITVKEICELADINRATFYSHYEDTYDLLLQIETAFITNITNYLVDDLTKELPNCTSLETLASIFEYFKENNELCSVLLGANGNANFQNQAIQLIEHQFIGQWKSQTPTAMSDRHFSYLYTFTAVGIIGILRKWLEEGMIESPTEIATMIFQNVIHGDTRTL